MGVVKGNKNRMLLGRWHDAAVAAPCKIESKNRSHQLNHRNKRTCAPSGMRSHVKEHEHLACAKNVGVKVFSSQCDCTVEK